MTKAHDAQANKRRTGNFGQAMTAFPLPTLLLVHGFPMDGSMWSPQTEALRGTCDVLAPDLRGFGQDRRTIPALMTMEAHARDLKELLDTRSAERVVLCGLSMGGYIAMAFLERWPERVAGLVLANTRATADDEAGKAARAESARAALERGMRVIARGMLPKLLSDHTRRTMPELAEQVEEMIARQAPEAAAASALGMAERPDRSNRLDRIQVPTLIITGGEDALMPLPTSQAMADAIPDARLHVIPGAGHLSNMEAPEAFNAALLRFMLELTPVNDGGTRSE